MVGTEVGATQVRAELPKYLADIVTNAIELGWRVSRGAGDHLILHSSGQHPGNPQTIPLPKDPRRMSSAKVGSMRAAITQYASRPEYDHQEPEPGPVAQVPEPPLLAEKPDERPPSAAEVPGRFMSPDEPTEERLTPNRRRIAALEAIARIAQEQLGMTTAAAELARVTAERDQLLVERDALQAKLDQLNKDVATAFSQALRPRT
jgi:hypothetical protein